MESNKLPVLLRILLMCITLRKFLHHAFDLTPRLTPFAPIPGIYVSASSGYFHTLASLLTASHLSAYVAKEHSKLLPNFSVRTRIPSLTAKPPLPHQSLQGGVMQSTVCMYSESLVEAGYGGNRRCAIHDRHVNLALIFI